MPSGNVTVMVTTNDEVSPGCKSLLGNVPNLVSFLEHSVIMSYSDLKIKSLLCFSLKRGLVLAGSVGRKRESQVQRDKSSAHVCDL